MAGPTDGALEDTSGDAPAEAAGEAPGDGPEVVVHSRVRLALHRLQAGDPGVAPLLQVHALGGRTEAPADCGTARWPGPVLGIDLTGHGASTRPVGGGYSPEVLMGDVDAALARLGPCVIAGWGIGAYVAVLVAGARPAEVLGVVLADGAGLAGAGDDAAPVHVVEHPPPPLPPEAADPTADPWAWAELHADARPPAHALGYLGRAAAARPAGSPPFVVVAATEAADAGWLTALEAEPSVRSRHDPALPAAAPLAERVAAALAVLAPLSSRPRR